MKISNCRKRKRGNQEYITDNQQICSQNNDNIQNKKKSLKTKNDFVTNKNNTSLNRKSEEQIRKSTVISTLPPEVKESDKMFSVQRWIENSPPNLPPWVQVTFDKVAILRSSEFPFEEDQLIRLIGKKFKSFSNQANIHRSCGTSSVNYQNYGTSSIDGRVINCLDCYYKSNIESPLKSNVLSVLSKMSKEENYFYKSLANTNVSIHGDPKTLNNVTNCPIHTNGIIPTYNCNPAANTNDKIHLISGDLNQKRNNMATPMDLSADSCTQSYNQTQYCQSVNNNPSFTNNNNSMSQVTLPARSNYQMTNGMIHNKNTNCVGPPSRNNLASHVINDHNRLLYQKQKGPNNNNTDDYSHPIDCQESGDKNQDRLYNEKDTHLIVKFFNEFFVNGSLPSLQEVRIRLSQTSLGQRRTPVSVRAKIKRLQASGRWSEYLNMV